MIVGIIGGIGAGKSTVTRMLAELGAETVDADSLAHEALETPHVRRALVGWIGEDAVGPSGKVNRKAVASLVFSSPEKLKELERLVHPEVLRRIEDRVKKHETTGKKAPVLVLDVPLLLASPLKARCQEVVFVEAAPELRRKRVEDRGWAAGELERREGLQVSIDKKKLVANHVIDNSRTLDETRRQVVALYRRWKKKEGWA